MEFCAYCGEEIEGTAYSRDGLVFCSEECADLYDEEGAIDDDIDDGDDFDDDEW